MLEVVMPPPEVFLRALAHGEAVALKRRFESAKHFSTRERAAGGRPRRITAAQRARIVAVAGVRPDTQGVR